MPRHVHPKAIPYLNDLGVVLADPEHEEESLLALDIEPRHHNTNHAAHGGVLVTLMDAAMARAVRYVDNDEHGIASIELKSTFMQPGKGRLIAKGFVVHRTSRLAFCEAEVRDEHGALVARASSTIRLFDRNRMPHKPE